MLDIKTKEDFDELMLGTEKFQRFLVANNVRKGKNKCATEQKILINKLIRSNQMSGRIICDFDEVLSKTNIFDFTNEDGSTTIKLNEWQKYIADSAINDFDALLKNEQIYFSDGDGGPLRFVCWDSRINSGSIKNFNDILARNDITLKKYDNSYITFSEFKDKLADKSIKNLDFIIDKDGKVKEDNLGFAYFIKDITNLRYFAPEAFDKVDLNNPEHRSLLSIKAKEKPDKTVFGWNLLGYLLIVFTFGLAHIFGWSRKCLNRALANDWYNGSYIAKLQKTKKDIASALEIAPIKNPDEQIDMAKELKSKLPSNNEIPEQNTHEKSDNNQNKANILPKTGLATENKSLIDQKDSTDKNSNQEDKKNKEEDNKEIKNVESKPKQNAELKLGQTDNDKKQNQDIKKDDKNKNQSNQKGSTQKNKIKSEKSKKQKGKSKTNKTNKSPNKKTKDKNISVGSRVNENHKKNPEVKDFLSVFYKAINTNFILLDNADAQKQIKDKLQLLTDVKEKYSKMSEGNKAEIQKSEARIVPQIDEAIINLAENFYRHYEHDDEFIQLKEGLQACYNSASENLRRGNTNEGLKAVQVCQQIYNSLLIYCESKLWPGVPREFIAHVVSLEVVGNNHQNVQSSLNDIKTKLEKLPVAQPASPLLMQNKMHQKQPDNIKNKDNLL